MVLLLIPMALVWDTVGPLSVLEKHQPSSKDKLVNDVRKRQLTHIDLTDLDEYITELEAQVGMNNPTAQDDLTYILLRLDKGDLEITKSGHGVNVGTQADGSRFPWMSTITRLVHELALYPVSMHGLIKDIRKRRLTYVKDMSQLDWYLRELTTDLAELQQASEHDPRKKFLQADFDYISQRRHDIRPLTNLHRLVLAVRERKLKYIPDDVDMASFRIDLEQQAASGDEQAQDDLRYVNAFLGMDTDENIFASTTQQQANETATDAGADFALHATNSLSLSESNGTETDDVATELRIGGAQTGSVVVE